MFEVREFCLHDGPGVRTTVFLKGCPLRCRWCHNPEGISPEPERLFKPARCKGCGYCNGGERNVPCPEGARVTCGIRRTAADLSHELLENAAFLRESGGGVTFSGGEPLMQPSFVAEVADILHREAAMHLAIETSGFSPHGSYREVVGRMDLVFQDLKHPDAQEHRKWTGVDPSPIHENLRWLKESGKPFVARIPLMPGVNDTPDAKEGFARLLEGDSGLIRVELLPYNVAAGAKYPFTGRKFDPGFDTTRKPDTDISSFGRHGLKCVVM